MSNGNAASNEQMQALHTALRDALAEYLEETPMEKRRASTLSVIRSFLMDNGVNVRSLNNAALAKSLSGLTQAVALPFPKTKQ